MLQCSLLRCIHKREKRERVDNLIDQPDTQYSYCILRNTHR